MMHALLGKLLKKLLVGLLSKMCIGTDEEQLRLHLESGRLLLENVLLDTQHMSQPNSMLRIRKASIGQLELLINWKHLLTEKLVLRIKRVLIEGQLVNRLRTKHEIIKDKLRLIETEIKGMIEGRAQGSISRCIKKKLIGMIVNNLQLEVSQVDFVLREEKAFNLHFLLKTFQLGSVSTSSESRKIHKLVRIELQAFNQTETKVRHDILSMMVMGEGEIYDRDDINDVRINLSVPVLKLTIDTAEVPKFLRKLDPLAKPNQREPLIRPYKNEAGWAQELLRYHIRLALERVQRNKFIGMLCAKRYNVQLLASTKAFTSLVFRMPTDLLRKWIVEDPALRDVALAGSQQQSLPLFEYGRYTLTISNIQLRFGLSKDVLSGQINECSFMMESRNFSRLVLTEAKMMSMQVKFNDIEVLNRIGEEGQTVAFRSQKQHQHVDVSVVAQNFKLNLNHEVIMRLVKTYYKLFPKQVTIRSYKLAAVSTLKENKTPPTVNVALVNALICLQMRVERQRIFNYLLIRRVDLGLVNHILKCRITIDHKFYINDQEVRVLDGVDIGVEVVRGKETILIVRDTRLKCNFGGLDRFLLILDKLMRLIKSFTDYFTTRTFQVYNCQKIGLVRYSTKKLKDQPYYFTIDGNKMLLFPASRSDEYPQKICTLVGKTGIVSMESANRTATLADGCELQFWSNKQFKQMLYIYEDLKGEQEEDKPLTILLQNTQAEVGFGLHQTYSIALDVLFGKVVVRGNDLRVLMKSNVEVCSDGSPILSCEHLSVSLNKLKQSTSITVDIDNAILTYSEAILAELRSARKKYFMNRQVESKEQEKSPPSQIGVVLRNAQVYLLVDGNKKFGKIVLRDFVVALDKGMAFEGGAEIYDLTSYPYTRFVDEPRLLYQTHVSFADMEIVLSSLKAVFIMEVTMRLLDYVLIQVDQLLNFLNGEQPEDTTEKGLLVRVLCKGSQITLYPTALQVVCHRDISIVYKKVVKERLVDLLLTTLIEKNVSISVPALLRNGSQQMMQESTIKLDYNLVTKTMNLTLPRLQLHLTNNSFSMLTKFIFSNIIYTDGFVLEPKKPKRVTDPNSRMDILINFDSVTMLLQTPRMTFELTLDDLGVAYLRRGISSTVSVAFYKLRVKELTKGERCPILNGFQMLTLKEDTFKTNPERKVLSMRMTQEQKSHLDIQFEELQLTGNKDRLMELAGFFQLNRDTPGVKANTPSFGMEIEVQFPRINFYLEAQNREVYILSLSCLVYMDTNFQKHPDGEGQIIGTSSRQIDNGTPPISTITSILKVNVSGINLRHFQQDHQNRRNIMNRPDLHIILQTVREVNPVNPKTMKSLNIKFDNCRLSLTLRDLLSLYSVVTYQQQQSKLLMEKQQLTLQKVPEAMEEFEQDFDVTQAQDDSNSMTVFQVEAEHFHIVIANNYSEQLLPLVQLNIKIDKLSGTLNDAVNVITMVSTLNMGYFNLSATRIEPILEPMEVVVEICRNNLGNPNNFVSIVVSKMLVNLSDEMLQTYRIVSRDLQKIDVSYGEYVQRELAYLVRSVLLQKQSIPLEEGPFEKNLVTLFSIKNETGFLLSIYERTEVMIEDGAGKAVDRKTQKLFAHIKKQEVAYYRVTQDENDFGNTFERSVKLNVYFRDEHQQYSVRNIKINNMLRNQNSLRHWCLAAGLTSPEPDKYFLGVFDITHYKKEFILKSKLYLKNRSVNNMIVRLTGGGETTDISLEKDEEVPLPFTVYLRDGLKFQTKAPSQPAFSEARLLREYILTDKELESFIKDSEPSAAYTSSDSVLMVPNKQIRMSLLNVNLLVDPLSKVQTITIMPVMRIYNYTPLDIVLEALELTVPANQNVYLNQCLPVQHTMMTMRQFRTKKEILLYSENMRDEQYQAVITLTHDTLPRQKEVNINIKRKKRKGILQVLLSARIVIVNETGLPLLVYLNECKSAEKVILANETDRMKLTSLHNNEYSKEVDLKELPHSYQMEYLEKNQQTSLGELYELCVNTTVHESYHTSEIIITKVIEITPRYIIDNRTCFELQVTQPQSFIDPIRYRPSSKGVLYWPDHNLQRRIVVRTFEKDDRTTSLSKWKWSGAFSVQNIRIIYFYVRKKAKVRTTRDLLLLNRSINLEGERIYFKAEVKRFSSYTCILIDEVKKSEVEHLLVNNTKYVVLFEQLNNRSVVNKDYFVVKPYSEQPFCWIQPDLKKKIKISLLDGERVVESPIDLCFDTSSEQQTCLFPGLSVRFRIRLVNSDRKKIEVCSMDNASIVPQTKKIVKPSTFKANYLTLLVKELGVSLIAVPEDKKLEIFFAKMDYISLTVQQSSTVKYQLSIKDFNIDNNTRDQAVYPVLLTSTVNLVADVTKQFLDVELEMERNSRSSIKKVMMLRVNLVPIAVKMDQNLAKVLLLTYRKLFQKKDRELINFRPENFSTINYVFETLANKLLMVKESPDTDPLLEWKFKPVDFSTNFIHIQRMSLPNIDITLTFNHIYSLRKGNNQVFGELYASFGLVIPNFENAPVRINGVQAEDIIDTTAEAVLGEIVRVYKNQIIANVLRVVGSANILGNPVRMFLILKNSFTELVQRPQRVAIYGPAAVVLTALQGVSGLLKACLTSTLHFMHSISGAVTNGVIYLSFDDWYIDKRRELNRFEPEDILEALESSFKSISFGFQSAFANLNIHHRRYMHESFGVATVKALAGFLIKPVASVMDGFNHILKGTQNMMTAEYYRPHQQRHRRMRVFYEKIRYFKEQSETDARVMEFLDSVKIFRSLKLIECYSIRTTNVVFHLVLTIEYIILIESGKVSWYIRPRDVHSIGFMPADRNDPLRLRDRAKIVLYHDNRQHGLNIILGSNDTWNEDLFNRMKRLIDDLKST